MDAMLEGTCEVTCLPGAGGYGFALDSPLSHSAIAVLLAPAQTFPRRTLQDHCYMWPNRWQGFDTRPSQSLVLALPFHACVFLRGEPVLCARASSVRSRGVGRDRHVMLMGYCRLHQEARGTFGSLVWTEGEDGSGFVWQTMLSWLRELRERHLTSLESQQAA